MSVYFLALLMLVQNSTQPAPKDEIKASLKTAADLFYEAKFNDSIQLLQKVTEQLQSGPDRLADKVNVKLQLALDYVGINDNDKAKAFLVEMYTLDPNTVLDLEQFSPKVIAMAADAKTTMINIRCQAIGDDARTNLKDGNAAAIRRLAGSPDVKCIDIPTFGGPAADVLYKAGMDAYKNSDYSTALQDFQAAVKFSPKHELAAQYSELAQGRLQVAEDLALIEWQKNFDAHKLSDAAVMYRKIALFNDVKSKQAVNLAGEQYRKALSSLVDTWNQTCPAGDESAMAEIRSEILELLPEPAFGEDIRSQMMPCEKPEVKTVKPPELKAEIRTETKIADGKVDVKTKLDAKPEVKNVPPAGSSAKCLQIDYRVAMTRIKTRVDPEIPPEARPYIQGNQMTVRVKVRIDDTGAVVSTETPGGNPMFNAAVKSAVERWKFSSALDSSGPRCVDTEIPIVIGPLTTSTR